jgi:NAD(P)-dependent dehydrogenase (short-subunit alcohol dehydrogenase family)
MPLLGVDSARISDSPKQISGMKAAHESLEGLEQAVSRGLRPTRVVVIGGFGNFGTRICRRLSEEAGIEVVATSRRAIQISAGTTRPVSELDVDAPAFSVALRALRPDVVIHCAGPYQGQDYRVVKDALACGAHYIDLADGRQFVAEFASHNHALALSAARAAVSGASTLPALSSAVIDHLALRFSRIDEIDIAIAPGQNAPRGTATMAAVLSYAGHGFPWLENGVWRTAHGWQELRRLKFPFGARYAAACDVPDLVLLPQRYPGVRTVTFRAALEVPLEHYALWCIAGLRRIGIPLPVESWAVPLTRLGAWLDRFGSDCGGMSVRVVGYREPGVRQSTTWNLMARSNHGPEIPCMAAVLLTLKLAAGARLVSGARPCIGMLTLSEFQSEFARWDISTHIDERAA